MLGKDGELPWQKAQNLKNPAILLNQIDHPNHHLVARIYDIETLVVRS